jgi:xanthine dehydrogenase accessory factor
MRFLNPHFLSVQIANLPCLSDNRYVTDLERILSVWRVLEAVAADYVLATIVEVQGSSYRKPGTCMLLAPDGRHIGTVSGGCLEAEVASRAWWLTANGPTVQRYSTIEDDGDLPYGSGCGGVVFLLLERRATARPLLAALEQAFLQRIPIAVATILEGPQIGHRAFAGLELSQQDNLKVVSGLNQLLNAPLQALAELALAERRSIEKDISIRAWANFRPARPGLCIFGAGDDALPLIRFAKELGWFVTVADGRSQLVTRERFPSADSLRVLPMHNESDKPESLTGAFLTTHSNFLPGNSRPGDAAVVMTHSFEQDARILASLLALDTQLSYIGVLGPQRRTRELLAASARILDLSPSAVNAWVDKWLSQLHAPMGLDLGAESPETIALSVLAEIQRCFAAATALPLREVRSIAQTISI